jgi:hypothetical protein
VPLVTTNVLSVLVDTDDQMGLLKLVQVSTTMTRLLLPVMLNPNRFVRNPKLGSLVSACGFHNTVGIPSREELQPVVPGK